MNEIRTTFALCDPFIALRVVGPKAKTPARQRKAGRREQKAAIRGVTGSASAGALEHAELKQNALKSLFFWDFSRNQP